MNCSGCGAALDPQAEVCGYCRAPTPHGGHVRAQREAAQRYQAQQHWAYQQVHKLSAHGEAQKLGTTALIWALVGLVPCFFLVPNIVSIVFAVKAHGAAKRANGSMPGTAIGAVVLSSFWMILMPIAMVMGQIDENKREARIAEIESELDGELDGDTVDIDTVCLLTEAHVLDQGFHGKKNLKKVECGLGKPKTIPDGLEVEGVRVTFTSGEPDSITVCLKKGTRWAIDKTISKDAGGCMAAPAALGSGSAKGLDDDTGATAAPTTTAAPTSKATETAQPTSRPRRR